MSPGVSSYVYGNASPVVYADPSGLGAIREIKFQYDPETDITTTFLLGESLSNGDGAPIIGWFKTGGGGTTGGKWSKPIAPTINEGNGNNGWGGGSKPLYDDYSSSGGLNAPQYISNDPKPGKTEPINNTQAVGIYGGPNNSHTPLYTTPDGAAIDLNRPDADGYITKVEADNWFQGGTGKSLYIPLDRLDLSGIYADDFKGIGDKQSFNLLIRSDNVNEGLVFGSITLILVSKNTVKALSDQYNFEWHHGGPLTEIIEFGRNLETMFAGSQVGNGKDYYINLYGEAKIKPHGVVPRFPWPLPKW